jgi:hypothetical protein
MKGCDVCCFFVRWERLFQRIMLQIFFANNFYDCSRLSSLSLSCSPPTGNGQETVEDGLSYTYSLGANGRMQQDGKRGDETRNFGANLIPRLDGAKTAETGIRL